MLDVVITARVDGTKTNTAWQLREFMWHLKKLQNWCVAIYGVNESNRKLAAANLVLLEIHSYSTRHKKMKTKTKNCGKYWRIMRRLTLHFEL